MRRAFAVALGLAVVAPPAVAWADDDEEAEGEDDEDEDEDADEGGDEGDEGDKPSKQAKGDEKPFKKQNLTGHADDDKAANLFEKDRFFVDKADTKKTAKGTLVQGSLTSTSFAYRESGDTIDPDPAGVPSASPYTRLFTDLRLQTDFRHISGGKWDARVDVRGRFVTDPGSQTPGYTPATDSSSQSGLLGENEVEIRELWLARSGKRTDLFFGRQFIPDLAGIKFDGLRFDYAQSSKFTLFGFGGLFPIRGSRSIFTDYKPLKTDPDADTGVRSPAGRFTTTGGFGAAYRTQNAYGAFGGVAIVPSPSSDEAPRVFGSSTGYWRSGPKLDLYHFAVVDLVGSNNAGLTNLSAGINYKPDQRLRATASFNRVDTETLNVQAQAFLNNPDVNANTIQNEAFLARIAQNAARASLSAGLGALQRFEVTVSTAFRYRGEVTLRAPVPDNPLEVVLPPGKSLEVYGAFMDRHSFAKLRLGVDGSRIFRVGDAAYQRATMLALRAFAARELANGHGEWEAEVSYLSSKDDNAGMACGSIETCFGAAKATTISLGGNLFYRINRDWLAMGSAFINRYQITSFDGMVSSEDPAILGLSGFFRAAYRF